jgi:hypothetical protein
MRWTPVESSVFISAAYDAKRHVLYLRFRSGEVYRYFDFSEEEFLRFLNAKSKGQHFANEIRDCFSCERLARLGAAGSQ